MDHPVDSVTIDRDARLAQSLAIRLAFVAQGIILARHEHRRGQRGQVVGEDRGYARISAVGVRGELQVDLPLERVRIDDVAVFALP